MTWIFIGVCLIVGCFGFVLLFGAPYVPILTPQLVTALKLANLQPGEHLLELGCGDGKVLVAAARQGIRVTGYELNPILVIIAWVRTRRYRSLVTVRCANFWRVDWPPSQAVFTFLLPKYMSMLDARMQTYATKQASPVRLISFAFTIHNKKTDSEENGIFVYCYKPGHLLP